MNQQRRRLKRLRCKLSESESPSVLPQTEADWGGPADCGLFTDRFHRNRPKHQLGKFKDGLFERRQSKKRDRSKSEGPSMVAKELEAGRLPKINVTDTDKDDGEIDEDIPFGLKGLFYVLPCDT